MPRGGGDSSQTARATLGLRDLIFEGDLRPGTRVPEVEIGTRLGVSRTPVRLALSTLVHEGLVEALPGGGFVVCSFSREDVFDAIELRGVLEGTAARLAAERLEDPGDLATLAEVRDDLDEALERLPERDGLARFVDRNEAFHAELVRLSRSRSLSRALARNSALPFASPGALLASHATLPRSREILVVAQHHHRTLVEAIGRRQGSRAEEIGREHARLACLNLELLIDDRDALRELPGHSLLESVA